MFCRGTADFLFVLSSCPGPPRSRHACVGLMRPLTCKQTMAETEDVEVAGGRGSTDSDASVRADFSASVKRWFQELTDVHMEPNQACALALKIAAGMAEPPVSVASVMQSLRTAARARRMSQSDGALTQIQLGGGVEDLVSMQDAAAKVYRLFSSPDSLHAAFWCPSSQPQPEDTPTASTTTPNSTDPQVTDSASRPATELVAPADSSGQLVSGALSAADTQCSVHDITQPPDTHSTTTSQLTQPGSATTVSQPQPEPPTALAPTASAATATDEAFATVLNRPEVTATTCEMERHGISLPSLTSLYAAISHLRSGRLTTSLISACERLVMTITSLPPAANPGCLRQLLVLFLNPFLEELEHAGLLTGLATALAYLSTEQRTAFTQLLSALPTNHLRRLVITLQQYITITLYQQQAITPGVEVATKALGLLWDANLLIRNRTAQPPTTCPTAPNHPPQEPLPYADFYNDAVNNEDFNLKEDFRRWKSLYRTEFSFCCYPYVYDPASKARVLQMECQLAQYNELHSALFRGLFGSSGQSDLCPFLVLKVRRGPHLVQDTLVQVHHAKEQGALRKPLKVKFVGEEGVDEGGVQKEFFQLLVRELFNPDYGMFVYDETVRLHWFRPSHLDMDTEFELVGILVGLAIYNSHILEFSFPLALYKLLVGVTPGLEDLSELHPEIHASLVKLLEMSEEEIRSCGLCFQVDVEYAFASQVETVELLPGQADTPVTAANVHTYVELYVQHLLQHSVRRQLSAFRRGFMRLCSGAALAWFRPEELELLVCGSRSLDLTALESGTLYDDGYCKESTVVRWFWEVVHQLNPEKQKRLLAFVTGSDRVPIKGLSALNPPFVISRMGGDPDRLPTAHTCFNHLLLPSYSSPDVLKQRLEMALENAEGFGLM